MSISYRWSSSDKTISSGSKKTFKNFFNKLGKHWWGKRIASVKYLLSKNDDSNGHGGSNFCNIEIFDLNEKVMTRGNVYATSNGLIPLKLLTVFVDLQIATIHVNLFAEIQLPRPLTKIRLNHLLVTFNWSEKLVVFYFRWNRPDRSPNLFSSKANFLSPLSSTFLFSRLKLIESTFSFLTLIWFDLCKRKGRCMILFPLKRMKFEDNYIWESIEWSFIVPRQCWLSKSGLFCSIILDQQVEKSWEDEGT